MYLSSGLASDACKKLVLTCAERDDAVGRQTGLDKDFSVLGARSYFSFLGPTEALVKLTVDNPRKFGGIGACLIPHFGIEWSQLFAIEIRIK